MSVKWDSGWFQGTVINVKKEEYGDHTGRFSFHVNYKDSKAWHFLHQMVEGDKQDRNAQWSLVTTLVKEATGTKARCDKRAAVKAELNIH